MHCKSKDKKKTPQKTCRKGKTNKKTTGGGEEKALHPHKDNKFGNTKVNQLVNCKCRSIKGETLQQQRIQGPGKKSEKVE